jgi:hypothetical protein
MKSPKLMATMKPKDDLGHGEPGTEVALMLLMVHGAIEGSINTKADRSPQVRRINAHHRISVTDGASAFFGGQ